MKYIPEAAMPKAFSWRDFVVPVPGLEGEVLGEEFCLLKRRKYDEDEQTTPSTKNAPNDGYRLTICTWENDGDNRETNILDDLSLETVRKYTTVLCYCMHFGNAECSENLQEEANTIAKISNVLKTECNADDLMHSLIGRWKGWDQSSWRVVDSVKLENIQNRDLIKKVDYNDFEKTAYELAVVKQKA
eukprot:TRINITY_DN5393_c0_g1_i1.p1 TRINITY_DN5393_c0_g1~~TRINITY_DN5393_c0_g1_i1.p1  ORF type:complete len:188 (+),score=35.33 TRINITY_DN5393_c0_g1_i1:582-1145(+)